MGHKKMPSKAPSNVRFLHSRGLLDQSQSARLAGSLQSVSSALLEACNSDLERRIFADALADADRRLKASTAALNDKEFTMIYAPGNRMVVEYLLNHSRFPRVALRLWAIFFEHLNDDCEVLLTREGMEARVDASGRAVRGALKELVDMRALLPLREPEPGKQGRGSVRYFINPRIASRRGRGEREAAYRAAPMLHLTALDGGRSSSERRSRAPAFSPAAL